MKYLIVQISFDTNKLVLAPDMDVSHNEAACLQIGQVVDTKKARSLPECIDILIAALAAAKDDNKRLRANLIVAGRGVGSLLSDEVSTDFLCGIDSKDGGVGREVELVIERYRLGLRWIALGIVGRQTARPDYEGQPFTDGQLSALLLEGIDIHGLVAPRKV